MKKFLIIFSLLLFLGGCADYKEVNEMAIVTAMGIDYVDDEFVLTLEVLNDKIDKDSAKITSYTRTARGKSLAVAVEKTADLLSHRAYYSHIKLVIISKEIAEHHINEITDFFVRSTYFRENFNIVVSTEVTPENILNIESEENPIASTAIISLLQTNGYASNYAIDKKFYIFFQEIVDFGKDAALSNINVENNNFYIDGLAIFDEYNMVALLENEDAVIYSILSNEIKKPVFMLTYEGNPFTISIYDIKSDFEITPDKIKVKANYKAKIMGNDPNFDIKKAEVLEELDEDFSKLLSTKIENFIVKLQKNKSDALFLAKKYYIKSRDKNDELWLHADIETDVKVIINKKGLIYSIYENN